jgi:hypothetical protein
MNLTEMRARVREDLQETNPADHHWTDEQIDHAIQRTVWEYSMAAPIQNQDDLPTTPGDHEIDISTLSRLLKVESVEFPIGHTEPCYQRFDLWAGRLRMTDQGDGTDARIRWLQAHQLTSGSTTVPSEHEEILVLGATGYLAMSASAYSVDRASIAGRHATINYRAWALSRLGSYQWKLRAINAQNRVVQRTLYTNELR